MHPHGCCVVQTCLDAARNTMQYETLASTIASNALYLMKDAYGNYVVQHIIENGVPRHTTAVVEKILSSRAGISELSQQKYSSNVVESCLKNAEPRPRTQLIRQIFEPSTTELLLSHKFGNYVVQCAFAVASTLERETMVEALKPHLPVVLNSTGGRRLVQRILENMPGAFPVELINRATAESELLQSNGNHKSRHRNGESVYNSRPSYSHHHNHNNSYDNNRGYKNHKNHSNGRVKRWNNRGRMR